MLKHNIYHVQHIKIIIITRHIYIYISLITNCENWKKKKKQAFCSSKSFLIFIGPSPKFLINWFLIKNKRVQTSLKNEEQFLKMIENVKMGYNFTATSQKPCRNHYS